MDLKEKYIEEVKLLKNVRINRVVQAAKKEFAIHGIINSKIKDIAVRAEVGEASVYRYFADKVALAKVVAFEYWQTEAGIFYKYFGENVDDKTTGLRQIEVFLSIFKELYLNHKDFLKFVEDFDNYMMSFESDEKSANFENMIMGIKLQFYELIKTGVKDGSIRDDVVPSELYSFVSQTMVSTTQKLAIRVGYLHSDQDLYPITCLNNLVEMFLCFIRKN